MSNYNLTINDALTTNSFKSARVIAGEKGLNKTIKWTHIIETDNFDTLLNGGELVLTTGTGLNLDSSLETYKRLIDKDVAGICIEIGPHFTMLPKEIKQFADDHHFPVIAFETVVKFVEITQKLHTHIINQHHQMLHEISDLTKEFNELSLAPNGILKILQKLNGQFKSHALFITDEGKAYYYPPESKTFIESLASYVQNYPIGTLYDNTVEVAHQTFALTPVNVVGQNWGYLCLQVTETSPDEYLFTLLDRAAMAIAQILLRNRTIEERKLNVEDELVQNLLLGKPYNPDELKTILPSSRKQLNFRVFICQNNHASATNTNEGWDELKVQQSMSIRSLFERYGFYPAISVKKNEIAVISFFNEKQDKSAAAKFTEITSECKQIPNINPQNIGVSGRHQDLSKFMRAYKEANEVLYLNDYYDLEDSLYEHIGVYRLLFQLQDNQLLESYIDDYIGPLLRHDAEMNTDLLTTLETYLTFNESKKETANRLFIVRQTLYHRLEKIEELLGKDYLEPGNRLATELAIKAYHLTQNVYPKE
ncbi:purine catabolism regulatory protein [Lentibacillus persicus]|uniref:Purine catabolism regulatory protein n=1 Tax=Lentibacillus persicus TaxID=640948 RepID=A0A1I2AK27_9BACI|nr:PucR family transcriptional regulator [Lentibacillus persicus]SFE44375.1 purine catabolism regulatory protein [Lentibacillus persicus]